MGSAKAKPAVTGNRSASDNSDDIVITPFTQVRIKVALLGRTPFVCNRQSEKVMRELLLPAIKLNRSARERVVRRSRAG